MKRGVKKIYAILPFKKEVYLLLRHFRLPYSITKHLTFRGAFRTKPDKTSRFLMFHYGYQLENELFWYGIKGWEKESLKIWIDYCKKSSIILDIGANTGIYSLIACAVNPRARAYAFEPVRRVYDKLKHNIKLNSFDIKANCIAISSTDGAQKIWDVNWEHQYGASLAPPETETTIHLSYNVPTITLDSFIGQNNIQKIDLIKIDVETFEPEVLRGYIKYFALHKPILLIEILFDNIGEQVQAFIETSGVKYNYFFIDEKAGLVKMNDIRRQNNYCYNYILIPD